MCMHAAHVFAACKLGETGSPGKYIPASIGNTNIVMQKKYVEYQSLVKMETLFIVARPWVMCMVCTCHAVGFKVCCAVLAHGALITSVA